jgi:hypothetical protein
MSRDLDFYFTSPFGEDNVLTRPGLQTLERIVQERFKPGNRQVEIRIPGPTDAGSGNITFGGKRATFTCLGDVITPEKWRLGEDLQIDSIRFDGDGRGNEKGGHDASAFSEHKAYLSLETAHITLPYDAYDRLVVETGSRKRLASTTTQIGRIEDVVDCNKIREFPNLELMFSVGRQGKETVVVSPEQYVWKAEESQSNGRWTCVLLVDGFASRRGTMKVSLGWAAFRGRNAWLDWDEDFVRLER